MYPPEGLKVLIIGDDNISWVLSQQFTRMHNNEKPFTTVRDTTPRTIRVPAESGSAEVMTIEVFERGAMTAPTVLQRYCLQTQAFVITFSMNSRASFDSIRKFMDGVVGANQEHCPIALVGMQNAEGRLEVTQEDAANRAAELGAKHFHVQRQNFNQVMAPFAYLARRHIQARSWLLKTRVWFR